MTGIGGAAVPCLSGNRNGLGSLNAYPPLRRESAACRAAAPAPRALSLEPLPPVTTTVPSGISSIKVADAVWDLFRDVFGIQKTSVRVVIGVASLPLGVPIGLDVIFEVVE